MCLEIGIICRQVINLTLYFGSVLGLRPAVEPSLFMVLHLDHFDQEGFFIKFIKEDIPFIPLNHPFPVQARLNTGYPQYGPPCTQPAQTAKHQH